MLKLADKNVSLKDIKDKYIVGIQNSWVIIFRSKKNRYHTLIMGRNEAYAKNLKEAVKRFKLNFWSCDSHATSIKTWLPYYYPNLPDDPTTVVYVFDDLEDLEKLALISELGK